MEIRQHRATGNVRLTSQARDALRVAARSAQRAERGGLVVGYRIGADVVVTDTIAVPDRAATRFSYVRREVVAREALDTYLLSLEPGSIQGYVGEWHTHAGPFPPSETDRRAMRAMVRSSPLPVVLLVAALRPGGVEVDLHALLSELDKFAGRARGAFLRVPVAT